MSKEHPFTEEQIRILEANPYTHSVTPNALKFTLEFKQFFYDQVVNQRILLLCHFMKCVKYLEFHGQDIIVGLMLKKLETSVKKGIERILLS